ncbi:RluA family pseudouridine synthase [uncultured Limosilactobacillus sp.]|uniref:RluA family pseudouridine synthase n=1 Tax=uncultured Limosilactobacillus sp. TaxID=2837629 RepID=UPI0025E7179D|nr:RluA family pseudouridine synthase [uncultured Limosilactobacillus sp.]
MENTWQYHGTTPIKIKRYLSQLGMGHRLFNDIKNGDGQLLVDHRLVRPTTQILPNQTLTIRVHPETPDRDVTASEKPIKTVFEDANWLVVNKPAGLASIPGPTEHQDTILNRVKGYLIQQQDENQRPHLITRLDKYTSGLLLVAKHRVASSMISQQVEHHTMQKRYLALVQGKVQPKHGVVQQPILRVAGQAARVIDSAGQPATTEYWVQASNEQYSLVQLQLHSGRTHQIRVHMQSLGHPLVGDHLYGGPTDLVTHQILHADQLRFRDPFTERTLQFTAPMPEEQLMILEQINLA